MQLPIDTSISSEAEPLPTIAVLLATRNGGPWIDVQVGTVLRQQGVALHIFVSDDDSTDDTGARLEELAMSSPITLLPPSPERMGSASANFHRLIRDVGRMDFEFFALCDQDDEWMDHRLQLAIDTLRREKADGFSSSVIAFWPDGREGFINNARSATQWDFLCGMAGQGCTVVLTQRAIRLVRDVLIAQRDACRRIHYHDWLAYALVRATGLRWVICSQPTVRYRQHGGNELGARGSLSALRVRHQRIVSGWFVTQIGIIARILQQACPSSEGAYLVLKMLRAQSIFSRIAMVPSAFQMRRGIVDSLVFTAYFLAGYLQEKPKGRNAESLGGHINGQQRSGSNDEFQ